MELGEYNIRVNTVCPGGIATAIFGRGLGLPQDKAERLAELAKVYLCNLQPIKRAGLPEDVAKAVLWLASDDSTFVTGHALVVDGGFTGGRMWQEDVENFEIFAKKLGIDNLETQMRKINDEIAKCKYDLD